MNRRCGIALGRNSQIKLGCWQETIARAFSAPFWFFTVALRRRRLESRHRKHPRRLIDRRACLRGRSVTAPFHRPVPCRRDPPTILRFKYVPILRIWRACVWTPSEASDGSERAPSQQRSPMQCISLGPVLAAWVGLTPRSHSSGGKEKRLADIDDSIVLSQGTSADQRRG